MAEQAYAYVTLIPVAKGFKNSIEKELGGIDGLGGDIGGKTGTSFAGGFGKSIKGLAIAAGSALAAVGAGKFFSDSIRQSSDLGESINAVNKAYGDYAGDVLKLGGDVANRLGLSTVDFNAAAVRFSSFAERVVGQGGDVAGFVNDISTRAADFASVFNIDVSEALAVFQSGLSGEAEPLKRFGINLLDSEVKAYALANGIGQVGRELTESEKVQARYGLLLQSTAKTAGDFADTSDGLANSQRILQASFTNMQAQLGNALVPAFAALSTAMIPVIEQLAPVLADVFNQVAPVITDIAQQLPDLLVGLAPLLPIMGELLTIFLKLVTAVLPLIDAVMIPVLEVMADILSSTLAPAIQATFGWMAENTLIVGAFFGTLATGVGIIKTVTSWTQIMTKAQAALAAVLAVNPWTIVAVAIAAVVAGIVYLATQTTFFQDLWKEMTTFVTGAWDMFVKDFKTGVDGLIGFFKDIAKNFQDFGNLLFEVGEDIIKGLIDGIINGAKNIIKTVTDVVGGAVEGVKDFLGIQSPSKVFQGIGENIGDGLVNGINNSKTKVAAAAKELSKASIPPGFEWVVGPNGPYLERSSVVSGRDMGERTAAQEASDSTMAIKANLRAQGFTGQAIDKVFQAALGGSAAEVAATFQRGVELVNTKLNQRIQGNLGDADIAALQAQGFVMTEKLSVSQDELTQAINDLTRTVQSGGATAYLAEGGMVTGPTRAVIGEAGPEVVIPLDRFENMMGMTQGSGKTVNYYAAPNQSIDSEQSLFQAMRRAKVVANW